MLLYYLCLSQAFLLYERVIIFIVKLMARFPSRNVININKTALSSVSYPFGALHFTVPRRSLHLIASSSNTSILFFRHPPFLFSNYSFSSTSAAAAVAERKPTIAIRREDINVWERRAPLSPVHVRQLVRQGFRVLVQPSNRRVFSVKARLKSYQFKSLQSKKLHASTFLIAFLRSGNIRIMLNFVNLACRFN